MVVSSPSNHTTLVLLKTPTFTDEELCLVGLSHEAGYLELPCSSFVVAEV